MCELMKQQETHLKQQVSYPFSVLSLVGWVFSFLPQWEPHQVP